MSDTHIDTDLITKVDTMRQGMDRIKQAVTEAIGQAQTPIAALELRIVLQGLATAMRELSSQAEANAIDVIGDGNVEVGGERYYCAIAKSYKIKDKTLALETILDLAGGDTAKAAEYLSSDFAKHGAIRSALETTPDAAIGFDAIFETKELIDLKTSKAKKQLVKAFER